MIELPSFCHMTASTIYNFSYVLKFLVTSWIEILTHNLFFKIPLFATVFIKTTFKDSKRVKIIRNYVLKCIH